MVCYPAMSSYQLKDAQLVPGDLKCQENTLLLHQHQPEVLIQGGMDLYFHVVYLKNDPTIQVLQQKPRFIRLCNICLVFCCPVLNCSLCSSQEERHPTGNRLWSSSVIAKEDHIVLKLCFNV